MCQFKLLFLLFQILGPIYPGQEFPLPLHLAESGCIRWRPIGDSYLWSEAYNISSIVSRDVKIGFLRSFVCYPSLPSSEAFRCCISVNGQCLSPVGCGKKVYSAVGIDSGKQCQDNHGQSTNNLEIPRNRLLYQVMLTSPLVLKNYLMKSMSVTLEDAGVTRTVFLSEVSAFDQLEIIISVASFMINICFLWSFYYEMPVLNLMLSSLIFRWKLLSTILILLMTFQ